MANLVIGPDGAAVDPSDPMSVVASAEQKPGIEDSDINDGWLIENTQQLDCGNGMMKYSITLPDGKPFECSPFQIEHRRDMSKLWMAAVRGEILSRANAAAEQTRAAALKAKREKQMAGAGIQVAGQIPTPEEAVMLAKIAAAQAQPPAPPEEAIREAVRAAKATMAQDAPHAAPAEIKKPPEGEADLKVARKELAKAKANVAYWTAMIESLRDSEAEASAEMAEASRAERIARTLQTSTVAKRK